MKKTMTALMMTAILAAGIAVSALGAEQGNRFSDVPRNHWASEAISWGVGNKVLSGFPNGTFAPEKPVTEAEFLKILVAAYEQLPGEGEHWYDPYYAYAQEKNWYVNGLTDQKYVNQPILRKNAALILSSALGAFYPDDSEASINASIQDLYDRGLSSGKTAKTIEGFKPNDTLTRAEAVQFIYYFVQHSGLTALATVASDTDEKALDNVTFEDAQGVLSKHEKIARSRGFQVKTYQENGLTFIQLYAESNVSDPSTSKITAINSAYKFEDDGTLTWNLTTNLDAVDSSLAYELLVSMFSFDSEVTGRIQKELIPFAKRLGDKFDGDVKAEFGRLTVFVSYVKESNQYYISSQLAKA